MSGPHHVSAAEVFPAEVGVADRSAGQSRDGPGAGSGSPNGFAPPSQPTPAFSPLNLSGPGKRKLPWAGLVPLLTCLDHLLTSLWLSHVSAPAPCYLARAVLCCRLLHLDTLHICHHISITGNVNARQTSGSSASLGSALQMQMQHLHLSSPSAALFIHSFGSTRLQNSKVFQQVPQASITISGIYGPSDRRSCSLLNTPCSTAGQFFQNTNWFMTGIVLAWVAVTIGYVIIRASQSLGLPIGIKIWGIWVLVIEVSFGLNMLVCIPSINKQR